MKTLTVTINRGGHAPAPAVPLYDLAIRTVEWFDQPAPDPGSFAILGGRGIDCWLEIGPAEVAFIRSIKNPGAHVDNDALWHWASNAGTDSGITIYYSNNPDAGTWHWGIGLMSSMLGHPRQYVAIENYDASQPYQFVSGIPYQANGDYSAWTPDKHPECWLYCPTIYPPSPGYPDGYLGWASHWDLTFYMPYFQPGTGFRMSRSAQDYGGWIKANCFVGPHG